MKPTLARPRWFRRARGVLTQMPRLARPISRAPGGTSAGARVRNPMPVCRRCLPALSLLLAVHGTHPLEAQSTLHRGQALDPGSAVRVDLPGGALRITTWERDSVDVRGRLDAALGRFYLGGTRQAVKLGIEPPGTGPAEGSADLELVIPGRSRLWVQAPSGEVDITPGGGSVSVLIGGGRVRLAGKASDISAESIDGNIELTGLAATARLKTASGTVVARGVVNDLAATSVSGPLLIGMEGAVSRVNLESVSGEIAFKGDLEPEAVLRADTHGGDIELRLVPDLQADFDVVSYGGGLVNQLVPPSAVRPGPRRGEWHFTTGDGRATVAVRTFKGTVTLKPKTPSTVNGRQ